MSEMEHDGIIVAPGELLSLLGSSVLLGITTSFSVTVALARFAPVIPSEIATGSGMLLGLLAAYPTVKLLARAGDAAISFMRWFAISFVNALLVTLLVSVL